MKLEINGKEYKLTFGLGFLRYLAEVRGLEASYQGLPVNTKVGALHLTAMGLEQQEVVALVDVLRGGMSALDTQPSDKELEEYLEELAEGLDLEKEKDPLGELFEEVKDALKKAPMVARQIALAERG